MPADFRGHLQSSVGFTKNALLEAKYRGIDTCVLRPAKDEDWEGYLRTLHVKIRTKTLIYEDAEIELVNGEKVPVSPHGMFFLKHPITKKDVFFDYAINTGLAQRKHDDGQPVAFETEPRLLYCRDDAEPVEVAFLRCRPAYIDGLEMEHIVQSPEDWVFMQYLPEGVVDEKHFFEFKELERLAAQFKKETRSPPLSP
ncbi:hypothetical protein [Sorangium sp. So ce1097]|uniref:hypothetical protein n=1 Tax=Sorangium sp. So ce1097 TaxID=3133330 RepID=UPI003F63ED98